MPSVKAKTQIQVVQDFLDGATEGRSGSGVNLIIKGDQLIHYQTVIAERYGDKIILNYSRYSIVTGKIQKAIKEKVPEDKLVLETDCPYMAPVPFRGKRCDSRMIPYTAEAAALVRGTDTQTILEQTCRNGERLFNI